MATRIGIISDTHGLLRDGVVDVLEECDCILHAGDVTDDDILDQIRFLGNLYVVRGNCDAGPWADFLKDRLKFQIEGLRFLMLHDRTYAGVDAFDADVIVFGHTHHFTEEYSDGRLWLNPGSCGFPRFGGDVTMAVMTVEGDQYQVERVDF